MLFIMDFQRQLTAIPDSQNIGDKAASRASLQEMFQGSIDPEVVDLILTESNYNVEDAIEKLCTLSSTSSPSESNQSSSKFSSATNRVVSDSPSPIVCDQFPPLRKTGFQLERHVQEERLEGKSFQTNVSPKTFDKTHKKKTTTKKTPMSNVSQRLVSSADNMFKSCIENGKENVDRTKASKTPDVGKPDRKPDENDESGFSDSFKSFMKHFVSQDSDSSEWKSVGKVHETRSSELYASGTQEKSLKLSQEESIIGLKDKMLNKDNITKENMDKDSTKTSKNMDPSKTCLKNDILTTTASDLKNQNGNDSIPNANDKIQSFNANDLKYQNANALPTWPDNNQLNSQLPQTNVPYFQNFQMQNMGFNLYPSNQQFQPRNAPFMKDVPYGFGPRFQPPMQRQLMGYHGQASYNQRSAHQFGSGPNGYPPGFVRPHNSMLRSPASKAPFTLPGGKVLVLMRGLPGSGKTTFAQGIKGNGIVLSADDFFSKFGQYKFEGVNLGEAHEWNQIRAREAMQGGISPVIIDNTNTQAWEMKPYVSMAKRFGYQVILKEPETYWKWNPKELVRRNQHGVTLSGIRNMMERYEHNITSEHILNSTNVFKKPQEEQNLELQHESPVNPNNSKKDHSKSDLPDKDIAFNQTIIGQESKESKITVCQENSKGNTVGEQRRKQDGHPQPDKRPTKQQQKKQMPKDVLQQKKTSAWNKKTTGVLEEKAMRSHGSRSPMRDIIYLGEEGEEKLMNNAECKANEEALENNLAPKQQRAPRKRERRTFQSKEQSGELQTKVETEELKSELELKTPNVNHDKPESVLLESGGSSIVEVISEYGSEGSHSENQIIELSDEPCSIEDQQKEDSQFIDDKILIQSTSDRDTSVGHDLGLQEIHKKTSHERSHVVKENVEDRCNDGLVNNIKSILKDQKVSDEKPKISLESDIESEVENQDSSSQLSTQSVTDDAYISDDEESDDVIIESDDNDNDSLGIDSNIKKDSQRSATLIKNESHTNSSEDSESELGGFEFLNTCFPDIDDKTLLGILSKHHGDVSKAIESILNNSAGLTKDTLEKSSLLRYPDSSYSSDNSKTEVSVCPKAHQKDASSPTNKSRAAPISHSSFQMTLEPAVAFHLLELFGPIDGVNCAGEFAPSDLSLTVDMEFSKLLYNQWKKSVQKRQGIHTYKGGEQLSPSLSKRKQGTKLKLQGPQPPPIKFSHKAADLREIMNEQMALEQSRREQEKQDSDTNMGVVLKRQKLYAMFPGVDPSALEELFQANNCELAPTVSMVQASCNLQPKPTALIEDQKIEDDWSHLDYFAETQDHPEKSYQALEDPEYDDFRAEANMHYNQRDECFKKAAFAFSRKQGQLAQFYASQGHLHTEKIKQANNRAAARILEHKNVNSDQFSLDLHGLHVTEALQALEQRLNPQDFVHKPKYISVVTGRGLHSKQGKAKIKPAVLEYLQHNNYRHEELHAGLIKVFLK